MEPTRNQPMESELSADRFIPWGSLAFFGVLILLAVVVWLGVYLLMLSRG